MIIQFNDFVSPGQVGRGDGELGERVAKESEEEGDLLVGDQRLENKVGHFVDDFFLSTMIVLS